MPSTKMPGTMFSWPGISAPREVQEEYAKERLEEILELVQPDFRRLVEEGYDRLEAANIVAIRYVSEYPPTYLVLSGGVLLLGLGYSFDEIFCSREHPQRVVEAELSHLIAERLLGGATLS